MGSGRAKFAVRRSLFTNINRQTAPVRSKAPNANNELARGGGAVRAGNVHTLATRRKRYSSVVGVYGEGVRLLRADYAKTVSKHRAVRNSTASVRGAERALPSAGRRRIPPTAYVNTYTNAGDRGGRLPTATKGRGTGVCGGGG